VVTKLINESTLPLATAQQSKFVSNYQSNLRASKVNVQQFSLKYTSTLHLPEYS